MTLGDFNQIKNACNKQSTNLSLRGAQQFQFLINNPGLIDFIPSGPWFTWCNNRYGDDSVAERLDRFLMLPAWLDHYPHASAKTLNISASDHAPIFISLDASIPKGARPFRLEVMWMHDGACDCTVSNAWNCCFFLSGLTAIKTKLHCL